MASTLSPTTAALETRDDLRPLRRVEYERLVDLGCFESERLELLNGRLVRTGPQKDPHASAVEELTMVLAPALHGRARVRVQSPIALDDLSEPEPDITIIAEGRPRGFHPTTALALIEVAETTLRKDLGEKAEAYARAGIPEYWVIDIAGQAAIVHLEPAGGRYGRITTLGRGSTLSLAAFPDVAIALDAVLG